MTVLGTQLTSPESGWVRYDNDNAMFSYTGLWNNARNATDYMSTLKYTSDDSATITFSFTGTAIRLISQLQTSTYRNNLCTISIDGGAPEPITMMVSHIPQGVSYEKTGLTEGTHTATIRMSRLGGSVTFNLDAIDVIPPPVKVGDPSPAPEMGWKRYDDADPVFKFFGVWRSLAIADYYKGTVRDTATNGGGYEFKFKGTRFRIIDAFDNNRSEEIKVTIDGVVETYSPYATETVRSALVYEKTGLIDKVHTVKVENTSTNLLGFDAVDIDSDGRLLHPDEVTDIDDLGVGKRIRCHYKSRSNTVGFFGGLGKETKDFIPPESTTAPDGDFYFIMVEDWQGEKRLIADRNIQHSISWDTLNTAGIASGSGVPVNTENLAKTSTVYMSDPYQDFHLVLDGDIGTSANIMMTRDSTKVMWIAFQLTEARKVDKIIITPRNGFNYMNFVTVTVEGSNDTTDGQDGTWETLVDSMTVPRTNDPIHITLDPDKAFKTYRMSGQGGVSGGSYYVSWAEIEMYEYEGLYMRLPTGGVTNTDKNNEWDRYIVGSDLGGSIVAGDDEVWNWSKANVRSWTSTSAANGPGSRASRASSLDVAYYQAVSTSMTNSRGFRPVLLIPYNNPISFGGGVTVSVVEFEDSALEGNINHEDGLKVRYSLTLNGQIVVPLGGFANSPMYLRYDIESSMLNFGSNGVSLFIEDEELNNLTLEFSVVRGYSTRYLVKVGTEYKVYKDYNWDTVGTVGNDALFIERGMRDLGDLTTPVSQLEFTSDEGVPLGDRSLYTIVINKKGKVITGIAVK